MSELRFYRPGRPFELLEIGLQLVVGRVARVIEFYRARDGRGNGRWRYSGVIRAFLKKRSIEGSLSSR